MLRYALTTLDGAEFASTHMCDWQHRWDWIANTIATRENCDPEDVRAFEGAEGEDYLSVNGAPVAELTFELVTP